MRKISPAVLFGVVFSFLALVFASGCAPRTSAQEKPMQAMSDDEFWALIGRSTAYEADPERQMAALAAALDGLSPEEIVAFEVAFYGQMIRANTWDLWGAAYVVHGGASDDGFEYFRRWLISKGRGAFERTLADPDSLADILAPDPGGPLEFEEFSYVAMDVWSRKTGKSMDDFGKLTLDAMMTMMEAKPRGKPFEEDSAHLSARYPKLWARFGENPLE